ncbi:MAG: hypothetical protein ABFS14_11035 [Gemmatimonadota bacterium]
MRSLIPILLLVVALPVSAQVPEAGGTLVVVNKLGNTASIIDVASGRTLASLKTGLQPHEVAISSDGQVAVVSDYAGSGGRTLTVIDVPGLAVARTIELGEHVGPHGIAFLPGDELVAVTAETSKHVVLVDVAAGEVVKSLPTEANSSHMLAVPDQADVIYTSNIRDGTVTEIGIAAGGPIRTFEVPPAPEAIGVTPDGSEVWVGSNRLGTVSVIDTGTGVVKKAQSGFTFPYRIAFTPDSRTVLIPDLRKGELRIVDRESRSEITRFDFSGAGPEGVTVADNGRWVFLALSQKARVAVLDLEEMFLAGYLLAGQGPDGVAYTSLSVTQP